MPDMTPIAAPDWAAPFEREVDGAFGEEEALRVIRHHDEVMGVVQEAVRSYVAANCAADGRLTGQYYVAREAYWAVDEPWFERAGRKREHRFSVMVHCLGMFELAGGRRSDLDHLGLEVHFSWYVETGEFKFHGGVDSSSI
jgi:hypothetical protein